MHACNLLYRSKRKEFSGNIAVPLRRHGGIKEWQKGGYQVLVDDVRKEWRLLWRHCIVDKVRAESIADRDYSLLFVDRGTVIAATRDFKPPDLKEILMYVCMHNSKRV